jgi:protein involved in polysaccharide export with SLBB domain
MADSNPAAHAADAAALYRPRCPDVLDIQAAGRGDVSGRRPIATDGRVLLGGAAVRVGGLTAPEIQQRIAAALGVREQDVRVTVAEYKSQSLYLFGEEGAVQRVVRYQGPETILDLLQRVGGASPGSTLSDVQVVRSHVADGSPPEVFHVNLRAILLRHDLQSNVRLEPSDRIYIAESRRSRLACCVPPVLQPLYRLLCGID